MASANRNSSKLNEYRTTRGWEGVLDEHGKIYGFRCKSGHLIICPTINRPSTIKIDTCLECKNLSIQQDNTDMKPVVGKKSLGDLILGKILSTVSVAAAASASSDTKRRNTTPLMISRPHEELDEINRSGFKVESSSSNGKSFTLKCKKDHLFIHQFLYDKKRIHCPICIEELACGLLDFQEARDITVHLDHRSIEYKCVNGHAVERTTIDILNGRGCVLCRRSSPIEKYIEAYLTSRGYKFEREVSIEVADHKLRCDFIVDRKTSSGKILIEADGEQHFNIGHYCKTKEELKRTQQRDLLKQEYALKMMKWSVIRIDVPNKEIDLKKYVDENLEKALKITKGIYFSDKDRYTHLMTDAQRDRHYRNLEIDE